MNYNFMRRGLAATTIIGGLTGVGVIVANYASASPHSTVPVAAAPVVPPPAGTLTQVNTGLRRPVGVAAAGGQTVMSNTSRNEVSALDTTTGATTVLTGSFSGTGEAGDGGPASAATVDAPTGTAVDAAGDVYIADTGDSVVREVNAATGVITRIAGTGVEGNKTTGRGNLAVNAELYRPQGVAVDAAGDLYVADTDNNRVVEVLPSGQLKAFAGTGKAGYGGDGHKATSAELDQPTAVAVDAKGNVYIADAANNVVRRVDAFSGVISTVAGDYAAAQNRTPVVSGVEVTFERGQGGYAGDGGPATAARLNDPQGVALDPAGDLFIADRLNNAVREVTPDGNIFTVVNAAGTGGIAPASGAETNGPATASKLNGPTAVAVDDSTGTVWISDTSNSRISKITGLAQTATSAAGPVAP